MNRLLVCTSKVIVAALVCVSPAVSQEPGCVTAATPESLAGRASPLDSIAFTVGGATVRVCYGRPSARGRTMIGGSAVPFGRIWRTGANEPSMIHTPVPLSIAGVRVEPGTYSLYTVPGETNWEIVVNRAYAQWGHERFYTGELEAQEVGRGTVPVAAPAEYTERFTMSARDGHLVMAWEDTEIRVPIRGS